MDSRHLSSDSSPAPITLRTGQPSREARFSASLYHLLQITEEGEERIELGYSGSRLLERLLANPGEVVSREELMAYAWADRVVGQGSLNQQIYTLRQVLGDEKERQIIQTLPRRGYLFNPDFIVQNPVQTALPTDASPVPDAPPPRPEGAGPSNPAPPRRARHWRLTAMAAGLGLLGVLLGNLLQPTAQAWEGTAIGMLHVHYLPSEDTAQDELVQVMQSTTQRLAGLSTQHTDLTLASNGDFYLLVCRNARGAAHWLEVQRNLLTSLTDAQLQDCLQ